MRNWFWYWSLRNRLPDLSDSALDRRYIVDLRPSHSEAPKYFERLRRAGWGPDEIPSAWRGARLLDLVEGDPACVGLKADFESPLWQMLSDRTVAPTWYSDVIERLLAGRCEVRTPGAYSLHYGSEFDPEATFSREPLDNAYLAMLDQLKAEATLRSLSMLCALFREALHAVHLHQLIPLANSVASTAVSVCEKRNIPPVQKMLFHRLIVDRVLGNVWIEQSDWSEHEGRDVLIGRSFSQRVSALNEFVHWYIFRHSHSLGDGFGACPIE
jgi:hypothetical protein